MQSHHEGLGAELSRAILEGDWPEILWMEGYCLFGIRST
jgi:hypothetical protein